MTGELSGQQIGPYELMHRLGKGVTGAVYLGLDLNLHRQAAIKILHATGQDRIEQFRKEAQILAMLSHPHIPSVYQFDHDEKTGLFYMSLQYIVGRDLEKVISDKPILDVEETTYILEAVAKALDYAHTPVLDSPHQRPTVIHGDVKLGNIMIREAAGAQSLLSALVYLVDFGFAWARSDTDVEGQVLPGTYLYMAPEILNHQGNEKSDQYSLAVVAYRLLTGTFPFENDDPTQVLRDHAIASPRKAHEVNRSLPSAVSAVLDRALSKKPDARFEDCMSFVGELRRALNESGKAAGAYGPYSVSDTEVTDMVDRLVIIMQGKDFVPDIVVGILDYEMPGGALWVGQLVQRLNSAAVSQGANRTGVGVINVDGRGTEPRRVRALPNLPRGVRRVLVFDSVSLSGKTIHLALEALRAAYPNADVRSATLLLGDQARDAGLVDFSVQSINERQVDFPWGLTKSTETAKEFFGPRDLQRDAQIVRRPWGRVDQFALNEMCTVRILNVQSNQRLSLHFHQMRDELFVALDDGVLVTIEGRSLELQRGDYYMVPRNTVHRFAARGREVRILEIGFGSYDQEHDIVRIEDDYGRPARDGSV